MKLYSYWRSSAAYRVRIALNVKGLAHDIVPVSLLAEGGAHKRDAFRKLNPQMLIPFLEDGAVAIGQSQAIFEYLEERYPSPPLYPSDVAIRARVRVVTNVIACDIHPLNNLRVINYLRDTLEVADAERDKWYAHWILEGFKAIEALLGREKGAYAFGNRVTFADACLVPQVANARRFKVPLDAFPRIVAATDACSTLEPFIKAAPENQPDAE